MLPDVLQLPGRCGKRLETILGGAEIRIRCGHLLEQQACVVEPALVDARDRQEDGGHRKGREAHRSHSHTGLLKTHYNNRKLALTRDRQESRCIRL